MMTLSAIGKKFNIPISTLRKAAEDGKIPASKPGRDWLVNIEDQAFKQFLENYRPREQKK